MTSKNSGGKLTLQDYLTIIDTKFLRGVNEKWTRFGVEWGGWSREMNIEVNTRVRMGTEDEVKALALYSYWICKSRMLQIKAEGGLMKRVFEYPRLEQEARDMREIVGSGKVPKKYREKFNVSS